MSTLAVRDVIASQLLGSPVAQRLGLVLDHVDHGTVQLTLPFAADNVTGANIVHGGVIASLADVAAVAAAVSAARALPSAGATANLSISYLSPAEGCALRATARALRSGARRHVVRVEIHSEDQASVAEALATVMLT